MKSSKAEQDIHRAETFKLSYGVETTRDILEIFRADYRKIKNIEGTKSESLQRAINLYQRYILAITFLYKISTIKNNLKFFKNIIKQEGGEIAEYALSVFHIGGGKDDNIPSIHKTVSAKTNEHIDRREATGSNIDIDVLEEIKRVKSLLDNKTYIVARNQTEEQVRSYYLAYILGLSTGRRFTEILKTATVKKQETSYIYNGILKKDKSQKDNTEVNLIVLSVDNVKSYLKELRGYINISLKAKSKKPLKAITVREVNTVFSKVFNNAVKRISDSKIPNFHELRHHYTIEGTELFKRDGESDRDTRYRILGHEIKEDTTRTYKTAK